MVGKDSRIKLLDLGMGVGSVPYTSPEQIRDERNLDGRSDIFSAGVLLYELLTGRLRWSGESEFETKHKIVSDPLPPLSTYLQRYPAGLDQILERALAKEVNSRYQDAEAMAFDLNKIQAQESWKELRIQEAIQKARSHIESRRTAERLPKSFEELQDENVQFTVYRPAWVQPARWYSMLAFAHLSERRPDAAPEML